MVANGTLRLKVTRPQLMWRSTMRSYWKLETNTGMILKLVLGHFGSFLQKMWRNHQTTFSQNLRTTVDTVTWIGTAENQEWTIQIKLGGFFTGTLQFFRRVTMWHNEQLETIWFLSSITNIFWYVPYIVVWFFTFFVSLNIILQFKSLAMK